MLTPIKRFSSTSTAFARFLAWIPQGQVALLIGSIVIATQASANAADLGATALLQQALEAQGGEAKLRAIRSVRWHAVGHRNLLEQSERPEGPYIVEYDTLSEVHDHAKGRYRSVTDAAVHPAFEFSSGVVADRAAAMRLFGGAGRAGDAEMLSLAQASLVLSPERVLLTALDSGNAHAESETVLQSVPHDVVAFTLQGDPVRIYLNKYTHLPTAVDYSGPLARSGYWQFLGDVTMRTYYSFWWLGEAGLRMPMQWNVVRNGLPDSAYAIRDLAVDAPIVEADMQISDAVRAKFASTPAPAKLDTMPLGIPGQAPIDLAPGITLVPGPWNVTFVRQQDGVVILDAPISSGYSAKVIAEARRRFPGLPVTAVITTSDAWPHIAGIREYAAEGIPIYCLDLNQPILDRMIAASYSTRPDALERTHRKPHLEPVATSTVVGSGPNKLVIYPIRGEASERQLMVYFPEHHLLYGSDAFQLGGDGAFSFPQSVTELMDAAARERIEPSRFFMMHIGPTPWADLAKTVSEAKFRNSNQ